MTTYEYTIPEVPVKGWFWGGRVNTQEPADKLNDLGRRGWQVAATNETNMYRGASRSLFIILQRETNQ